MEASEREECQFTDAAEGKYGLSQYVAFTCLSWLRCNVVVSVTLKEDQKPENESRRDSVA